MSGIAGSSVLDLDAPQPAELATRGACRDEDPEAFFPLGNSSTAAAKAVCRTCSVAAACLTWALDAGMDHGIWGGTDEGERRALKRRQGAKAVTA